MAVALAHAQDGINIKALQTGVLSRLLSLRSSSDAPDALSASLSSLSLVGSGDSSWKVLIYDRYCQDILSPLLTVAELRALGITLHMSLTAPRERVPDVPAVYICRPTAENIAIIARDVRRGIYDSTHLNFSTPIPRTMLEQLAQAIAAPPGPEAPLGGGAASSGSKAKDAVNPLHTGAAAASRIVRVMDQYCEFVSLEERLFTLNSSDSFVKLHGASTPADEAAMFAHVDDMVESLFCVVVTMGVVPIIRARAGHAAEMVAQKLEARLRDHLSSRNNLFASSSSAATSLSFHRPLLVILDRTFDLAAPILHSWTYQALLHDLLAMHSNRVTVSVADAPAAASAAQSGASSSALAPSKPASKPKTYDLLSSEDKFWKHNAGKPFPKVAEAVQERLDAYQKEFQIVTRKAGGAAAGGVNTGAVAASAGGGGMDEIAAAINSLPKLQRRKKLLDTHMNIATALLREIKSREIDVFFDVEQSILQRQQIDKQMMSSIFGGSAAPEAPGGKGSFIDKLRFFLVYFLATNELGEEQVKQYKQLLASVAHAQTQAQAAAAGAGADAAQAQPAASMAQPMELGALDFVQHFKFLHRLTAGDDFGGAGGGISAPAKAAPGGGGSGGGGMLGKLADSLYGGGVGLLAGVRNLLPTNNHLPITRIVESLMANKADDGDKYKYFDPKVPRGSRVSRMTGSFKESVVFVLGGGNYNEYQNLQDWQKEQHMMYGCSELVSPEQFIKQLATLHHTSQQATAANVPVD